MALATKRIAKPKFGKFPKPQKSWPQEEREEFLRNFRSLFHGKLPTVRDFLKEKKRETIREG